MELIILNDPEEQDTFEDENISDIFNFLLPEKKILKQIGQFGMFFNKRVFSGWVKQPSPCCGAASVAGAWNSLLNIDRLDERSLNHLDVLSVYSILFLEKLTKQIVAFERRLGSSIKSLLFVMFQGLANLGKTVVGKKLNQNDILIAVRGIFINKDIHQLKAVKLPLNDIYTTDEPWYALMFELVDLDNKKKVENEKEECEDDIGEEVEIEEKCAKKSLRGQVKTRSWKKDLTNIFHTINAIKNLSKMKPSTANIGNANIIEAVHRLAEMTDFSVKIWSFMGIATAKRGPDFVRITKLDTASEIERQWEAFRSQFCRRNSVVLFHCKNHYALCFAVREWDDCRQVLCALRGQRPSHWYDWAEVRQVLLLWEGYKLLGLSAGEEEDRAELGDYKAELLRRIQEQRLACGEAEAIVEAMH